MIAAWFSPTPHLPVLGGDAAAGALPLLFALIVYVAALAGLGIIAINGALGTADDWLSGRLTVQVPADASDARLQTILAALRQTPGLRSVQLLTSAETARLLEPWLGSPVPIEELPVPRLVDLTVEPGAAVDVPALRQQLAAIAPAARLDDQRSALGGLRAAARPLFAVLAVVIGFATALSALLAVFATGAALAIGRPVLELMNLLGAAETDMLRPFAARMLRDSILGSGIAMVAAALTVAALDGAAGIVRLPGPGNGLGLADWRLWTMLAGAGLTACLVATLAALATARRRLRRLR